MIKTIAKIFVCLIAVCCASISAFAQSSVAYVVEIEGNWILNGSNVLTQGEKLPAGGGIRRGRHSASDRIVVNDLSGNIVADRTCAEQDCAGTIVLPSEPETCGYFCLLMEKFKSAPKSVSAHRGRSPKFPDGVVEISGGKVDLSSLIKVEGEQYIKWRVISQTGSSSNAWTQPVKLDKTAVISGLQPGLYEMNLLRGNGGNYEPQANARILLAEPAQYQKAFDSFQEIRKLIEKWGKKVKPETGEMLLQSALIDLANQNEPKKQ